jgi:hypothetical protein
MFLSPIMSFNLMIWSFAFQFIQEINNRLLCTIVMPLLGRMMECIPSTYSLNIALYPHLSTLPCLEYSLSHVLNDSLKLTQVREHVNIFLCVSYFIFINVLDDMSIFILLDSIQFYAIIVQHKRGSCLNFLVFIKNFFMS